ncbi:MAG: hypothetical protein MSG64_02965 [Pyrinomonadaceae bacterium MAG19_C2-C3]|nr:hypothetical protein [Pyrinomonadaceae bacterium MAG19_C2-C3]
MWKQVFDLMKRVVMLTQDVERQRNDMKDVRRELKELAAIVERLVYELQRQKENETHEREKLELRLENALLRARQLPPNSSAE